MSKHIYHNYPATLDANGVLRWDSNGACVPPYVLDEHGWPSYVNKANQIATCKADNDAFLAAYRANPPQLSPEDRAEALRELGPNAINVVTGKRI